MGSIPESFDPDHARVLVVGPMRAGKTTLVSALCHGTKFPRRARSTIGCNVDVKLMKNFKSTRFIEFWDIGGHPSAALARRTFLEQSGAAGVLLVYDSSNPRSIPELWGWIDDLASAGVNLAQQSTPTGPAGGYGSKEGMRANVFRDLEGGSEGDRGCIPTVIVGNKADIADPSRARQSSALIKINRELSAKHIHVSAQNLDDRSLHSFFEDVFRYHTGASLLPSQEPSWTFPGDGESSYDSFVPAPVRSNAHDPLTTSYPRMTPFNDRGTQGNIEESGDRVRRAVNDRQSSLVGHHTTAAPGMYARGTKKQS